jgi:hypothetical protein
LPRVVISLLSRPQVLDPDAARLTLTLATSAIELLPEALRQLTPTPLGKESVAPLQRLTLLALEGAQRLALLHGFGEAYATAMDALSRSDSGSSFWALLPRFGPGMARAFRKLGQTELAEPIIRRIGQRFPGEDQLSIAGLWLAIGEEARAIRELDLARERLFIQPFPDDRTRGEFALRYIAALEFAPPRLALGRLEELFLRLESVDLAGATARYYALKPLEIVDATVAAVVNDDFNMGPRVRGWLDDHEFQIRKRIARDVENALAYPPEAGASSFSAFGTTR